MQAEKRQHAVVVIEHLLAAPASLAFTSRRHSPATTAELDFCHLSRLPKIV